MNKERLRARGWNPYRGWFTLRLGPDHLGFSHPSFRIGCISQGVPASKFVGFVFVWCLYYHSKYKVCRHIKYVIFFKIQIVLQNKISFFSKNTNCVATIVVLIIVDIYDFSIMKQWRIGGGIVWIYCSGGKPRQKTRIPPIGDYYNGLDTRPLSIRGDKEAIHHAIEDLRFES